MRAKKYRIYFNRKREWPQIWSIDEGTPASEINVIDFSLFVPARSCALEMSSRAGLNPHDAPFAWLECEGVLLLQGGTAYIRPEVEP